MIRRMASRIKHLLVNPWIHHFIGEWASRGFERLVYLHRFSRWLDDHAVQTAYADRTLLWEALCRHRQLDRTPLTYLEFGVYKGDSIRWWAERIRNPEARFIGFDTFGGLPEEWGPRAPKGTFTTEGAVPQIDDSRVTFQVGLFLDTVDPFLGENACLCGGPGRRDPARRIIAHLDADLYCSTLCALVGLRGSLTTGDILLFDDFRLRYIATEFRAFQDFVKTFGLRYEVLGCTKHYVQTALEIR